MSCYSQFTMLLFQEQGELSSVALHLTTRRDKRIKGETKAEALRKVQDDPCEEAMKFIPETATVIQNELIF